MNETVTTSLPNFAIALPEIFVLAMGALTLLAEIMLGKKYRNLSYLLVQVTLIVATILSYAQVGEFSTVSFSGLFVSDDIANILKIFIYISAFGAFYYSHQYLEDKEIPQSEYYILGLFSTLGMMVLVSAHSLLTIYLGLETLSFPIYAMIALRRHSEHAIEASLKYFVMGAIASGILLYGMSMIYGATGSLDLSTIASTVASIQSTQHLMLSFALMFIIVGIGFKLASVPFHMWAPDVYTGAPSAATMFLSTAPKLAAMGMAFRLLLVALPSIATQWQPILIALALLSTVVGNLVAIAQKNIKRMLAYSAISQVGYALFGLLAGTQAGYAAALFYMAVYALMALAGFGLIVMMSKAGFEAEHIEDFKGLNTRNPWLAFMMMIVMFSMAGVPPTVGFFAKLLVLKALIDVNLAWVALVGVLFAVVGAYYYIRIIKVMYFDSPKINEPIVISADLRLVFSLNALSLLVLGLFPGGLIQACMNAFTG